MIIFIFCYQYGKQCKNAVSDGFNSVDGHFLTCNVCFANHINIYHDKKVYQIKGNKQFNALKYVNFYYHYKNVNKGEKHGKFLGL